MPTADPYVFISHKHSDAAIATAVSSFLSKASAGNVKVHNSSNSDFEGPRIGQNLNEELKNALAEAEVLLLIFTSEGEDWQYCMWECGIATDPWDEHPTDVIVLQCGKDIPKAYGDRLRVQVRDKESVQDFTKEFLTRPDFFPGRGEPIATLPESAIKEQAEALFKALEDVLPDLDSVTTDFAAATFLRIELPAASVAKVRATEEEDRKAAVLEVLGATATIVDKDRAQSFFGFEISTGSGLGKVLDKWKSSAADDDSAWLDSLADQIELAILEKYPEGVPWAPIRKDGDLTTIPYVTRSRTLASGAMQFDTQFIPLAPQPLTVVQQMIAIGEMYSKDLDTVDPKDMKLHDLIAEMGERTRLPVLGDEGRPQYVIHAATIHKFTSKRAFEGDDVKQLTLHDLLADEELEAFFASTFAVVSPQATLGEAQEAMEAVKDAQDVFVTEDGTKEMPVVGWLTNITFLEA